MAKHLELAAEMMRADAGFHTDQARCQIGKPRFHLARRPHRFCTDPRNTWTSPRPAIRNPCHLLTAGNERGGKDSSRQERSIC